MDRNAEALERLYRERYARFRDGLAPVTGSYDTAHDVVQEAFATAFARRKMPLSPSFARANESSPILAYGSVSVDGATYVEIELEGGERIKSEVVWVSEPIDAGFYAVDLSELPTAVVARDDDGDEVVRRPLPPGLLRPRP